MKPHPNQIHKWTQDAKPKNWQDLTDQEIKDLVLWRLKKSLSNLISGNIKECKKDIEDSISELECL